MMSRAAAYSLLPICNLQGCVSDSFIDASILGGPKVFVVATLASMRPAEPFAFRSYELPLEVEQLAREMRACRGSSKHLVWQVSSRTGACWTSTSRKGRLNVGFAQTKPTFMLFYMLLQ